MLLQLNGHLQCDMVEGCWTAACMTCPVLCEGSVQFSSVAQSCPTLCDPMDCSFPGFPVHHQLLELAQTHVHRVGDATQPSCPLSSSSPPAFNRSYHQGLFQWVSSSHQVARVLEFQLQHHSFQWIFRTDFFAVQGTLKSLFQHHRSKASILWRSAFFIVQLFATPWTAACQASLSITSSWSLLNLMSIESVMPSSHLILCRPLFFLPPIPPSIRGTLWLFSNESALHMRWPKYWTFSFSIIPSKEHLGLISFRMDWLDLLAVQGTLKSLLQHHSSKTSILQCSAFFTVQLSHPYMTTGKTIALSR